MEEEIAPEMFYTILFVDVILIEGLSQKLNQNFVMLT